MSCAPHLTSQSAAQLCASPRGEVPRAQAGLTVGVGTNARRPTMYLTSKASRIRQREAQRARDNRAEIIKARSIGQITRRDLIKWGILTATGALALKNGLSPFARSAFAAVPTGTPRSPLYGAAKFSQRMPRLTLQTPLPLTRNAADEAVFSGGLGYPNAKRLSYHNDFSAFQGPLNQNPFRNPVT